MTSDDEKRRDLIWAWPTQDAAYAQIQHMPAIIRHALICCRGTYRLRLTLLCRSKWGVSDALLHF
jgi:hypothetical protein